MTRFESQVCLVNGVATSAWTPGAGSRMRVNAVLFGPIETPAQRAVFERNPGALEKRLVHWPMGRFGTLDEAAGAIAFLASADAGFITAAALPLDGGITQAFTVPE